MDAAALRRLRKENPATAQLLRLGWYHGFEFEDGTSIPGVLPVETSKYRYSKFPIPEDLTGKRVLDIGTWDGWFSFEAERHGAEVTAVDLVEMPTFWEVHRKLGSRVTYRELDLFDIPQADLGTFDYVFFLGVLYHTKYPLLALELVCGLTSDTAIVESYVTDGANWEEHRDDIPVLEFYEADELGGQLDNWFGPTVGCLIAMCRAAGFCRTELLDAGDKRAALACYRKWSDFPAVSSETITLRRATNTIRLGINFRAKREEYISWWFDYTGDTLHRDEIRLEIGLFGVPAMHVTRIDGDLWSANSRLLPGLEPGWYPVRASIRGGPWTDTLRIAVDIESHAEWLEIDLVCDGHDWARGEVHLSHQPSHVSLWVRGLGENCDTVNTSVFLDDTRLKVTYTGPPDDNGARQVNAELPGGLEEARRKVSVRYGGAQSPAKDLDLVTRLG